MHQLADAYQGAEQVVQKRLRTGLQDAAKPLPASVVREGSSTLPAGGGLRARAAGAKGVVTTSERGRAVSVSIRVANREGDDFGAFDRGEVRHSVFGLFVPGMKPQRVPAGRFSSAFRRGEAGVTRRADAELGKGLDEIARKAD